MVATPLVLFLAFAQRPKGQYTLEIRKDAFVVRDGARTETAPREEAAKPKDHLSFRADRRWAVWDARGLTVRDGDWSLTDRLEAVATSPKIQEKDAIRANLAKIKAGERTRAASGLSGARRIGTKVYLLPRWDDKDGEPWLEALVVVDLAQPHPKPRLLGRFPGVSLGRGPLDDRLGIQAGRLAAAVNGEDAWGLATFDPAKGDFDFEEKGRRLVALDGGRIIEETPYGTLVVGRRVDGDTEPLAELRGPAEFVSGDGPILVRAGLRLRNAETGAEFRLPRRAAIRRTKAGLLVFWPEDAPRSARLLDPDRLEERARWEKGTVREGGRGKREEENRPAHPDRSKRKVPRSKRP